MVKNQPANEEIQETQVQSLGQEDPPEKERATHSSILVCRTSWTVARKTSQSMGYSRQEYWSGLPFPSLGDLPDPGTEPVSPTFPALQVNSLPLSHGEAPKHVDIIVLKK